jgi:L,D-peptidoglycan transpeptidase YkuD (ErfK/YbiS/YcfS/YnhG family)
MTPIAADMLWCDAPGHALYNRPARSPLAASHERMMREDHLYDICLVMDWNVVSRRQGRGSAIFFHLARPGLAPTEGCIAIRLADMRRLLALVKKGTMVRAL